MRYTLAFKQRAVRLVDGDADCGDATTPGSIGRNGQGNSDETASGNTVRLTSVHELKIFKLLNIMDIREKIP
ncbi:MAG: hypothetical protein FD175_2320 [Beijerinckiaceae bacterium]|nr:MAG: hypothetical protein FD175_2320 [Beijerinckiaceae bacterium]